MNKYIYRGVTYLNESIIFLLLIQLTSHFKYGRKLILFQKEYNWTILPVLIPWFCIHKEKLNQYSDCVKNNQACEHIYIKVLFVCFITITVALCKNFKPLWYDAVGDVYNWTRKNVPNIRKPADRHSFSMHNCSKLFARSMSDYFVFYVERLQRYSESVMLTKNLYNLRLLCGIRYGASSEKTNISIFNFRIWKYKMENVNK